MIDITKKIMEAMKSHDRVASETYKLVKAKIIEFNTMVPGTYRYRCDG